MGKRGAELCSGQEEKTSEHKVIKGLSGMVHGVSSGSHSTPERLVMAYIQGRFHGEGET